MEKRKREESLTLVELLIVISVLGILLTAGMIYYQSFNRRQILDQATKDLENNLRHAQSKALTGEKPQGWCDGKGETLAGYRLEFFTETNYQIAAVCSNGGVEPIKIIKLPNKVLGPEGTGVLFKVLAQGAEPETTFLLKGFGREKKVVVEVSGNIKIE